ncbi:MAG TPA: tripartite tricarboxylate transporter substrate-binding protein [Azospirillaceae bacterium]|nr:tripartite tricarboxylate transporter substrate-binding protein [Azospirillaceae bacterium]
MTLNRRDLVRGALLGGAATAAFGAGLTAGVHRAAAQQTIDTLQLFVPAAPGGGWDQTARTMELVLRQMNAIGAAQVTNVPGAGGAVGLPQFVNQWRGRQNTLMVAGMVMVGAIIANKSPVNLTMTTPIARLTGEFEVIVVPAESPHKDMRSLTNALKQNPGGVSWAGGSAGGTDHILVGMIAQAVGVNPTQASYVAFAGGGPAQAALLGNQVTAGVSGYGEFAEQVKAGKLRALAISADTRQPGIDVPTLKEQGIDVELFNWRGVFAPPGVNAQARQNMIQLMERMSNSDPWKQELARRDWTGIFLAGDQFTQYVQQETERVTGVLKSLGLAT